MEGNFPEVRLSFWDRKRGKWPPRQLMEFKLEEFEDLDQLKEAVYEVLGAYIEQLEGGDDENETS